MRALLEPILAMMAACLLAAAPALPVPCAAGDLAKSPGKDATTESVRGVVQGVDNNQVRIKADGAGAVAVRLDSQTRITLDGKDAGLTDLKAGQAVSCTFVRREGMNRGLAITATSAKK